MRTILYLFAMFIALDEPTNVVRFGVIHCFQSQISPDDVSNDDCTDLAQAGKTLCLGKYSESSTSLLVAVFLALLPSDQPSPLRDCHTDLRC
jgi:hypothetical protein